MAIIRLTSTQKSALLSLLLLQAALAQSPWQWNGRTHPELHWQQIETEHFRIIYHQGLEELAREGAALAEAAYQPLLDQIQVAHTGTIDIVFTAEDEIMNGFARPDRRIVIWVSQNDAAGWFLGNRKWLEMVLAHEIQHVVLMAGIETWLGIWNLLMVPSWFIEGMAEYYTESWRVGRSDRVLKVHTYRNRLGDLNSHDEGYAKVLYLADRFGDSSLVRMVHHRDTLKLGPLKFPKPYSFKKALKQATGLTRKAFDEQWRQTMQTYYFSVLGQHESVTETGQPLPLPEMTALRGLAISPDTAKIALIGRRHPGMGDWGLYVLTRDSTRQLDEVHFGELGLRRSASNSPAWSPDGRLLAVSEYHRGLHGSLLWDIRLVDLETGQARWLTQSARAHDPVWSPDGSRLLYVAHPGRATNLYLTTTAGGPARQLTSFTGDIQIQDPRWSPDGSRIAFAVQTVEGEVNIAVVDSNGGNYREITSGRETDLLPLWEPDGRGLIFTSFRQGTPNLYRISLSGGEAEAMSDVAEGLYGVQVLAGTGEVLAMTPDVDSVRVRRIPLDQRAEPVELVLRQRYSRWRDQAVDQVRLTPGPLDLQAASAPEPYRWWRTWKPLFRTVLPLLPDISAFGLWSDALGKNQLLAELDFRLGTGNWNGLAMWINASHTPLLNVSVYKDAVWRVRGYGDGILVESISALEVGAQLPLNLGHRLAANHTLTAALHLRSRRPVSVPEPAGPLGQPEEVREGGWTLGYRWKYQRPDRRNSALPRQGMGTGLRWDHFSSQFYGDRNYGHLELDVFSHNAIGRSPLVIFSRWVATVQYGKPPGQDRIGLQDTGPFLLHPGLGNVLISSFLETVELHSLRGLSSTTLGTPVAHGTHELRLPVMGRLPVNVAGLQLRGVTLALFTDYGAVWQAGEMFSVATFGWELKANLTVGGMPLVTLAVGLAGEQSDWDLGTPRTYLRLGMIQPF